MFLNSGILPMIVIYNIFFWGNTKETEATSINLCACWEPSVKVRDELESLAYGVVIWNLR